MATYLAIHRATISQAMRNIIKSLKSILELPKKQVLTSSFHPDKNFYFIEKGIARSFCVLNGKEVTSWFSAEGDIVYCLNFAYVF